MEVKIISADYLSGEYKSIVGYTLKVRECNEKFYYYFDEFNRDNNLMILKSDCELQIEVGEIKIRDYKNLINLLPVMEQCDTTKIATWKGIEKEVKIHNDKVLNGIDELTKFLNLSKEELTISRQDCFNLNSYYDNPELFVLAVIFWGYPAGGRGGYIREALNNGFDELLKYISKFQFNKEYSSFQELQGIKMGGFNISTYSKFWYFQNVTLKGVRCLILDSKIIDILNAGIFTELHSLKHITYLNASKYYFDYIDVMDKVAKENRCTIDHLEYFIYTFGNRIKKQLA